MVDTDERARERTVERTERDRGGEDLRRWRRRHSGLLPPPPLLLLLLQAVVRGGGRLGRLEGVPFQTLRIDLFVDGPSSLHPLLVVVDHVLKLFQRFSIGLPLLFLSFFFVSLATIRALLSSKSSLFTGEHLGQSQQRRNGIHFSPCLILLIYNSVSISSRPRRGGGERHRRIVAKPRAIPFHRCAASFARLITHRGYDVIYDRVSFGTTNVRINR